MRVTPCRASWLLLWCLLLSGCVSSHQRTLNRLIKEDGGSLGISHIESIVLPPQGEPAHVLLYPVGAHASRAQVVAFRHGVPAVLFSVGSSTPNTDFRIEQGVPMIMLEQADYAPDYATGYRYAEVYAWDGNTFSLKAKNPLEQHTDKNGFIVTESP